VSIASGDRVSDTVLARPPEPLVVQVLGEDLAPLAGVEVRFLSHPIEFLGRYRTRVSPSVDTTDATGRVAVAIYLGNTAGEDTVTARAPALETEAIARFTVLPGNAAGVAVLPRDTAVYVDRSFRLRGSLVDRWGNPRAAPVAYATGSPAVRLSRDVVTGAAIGRAPVIGSAGAWRDTAWVSVVPPGAAAAVRPHLVTGDTARIVFFNFDGSGCRSFDVVYWASPRPDWASSGDAIVMENGGTFPDENGHLVLADSSGPKRRLLDPAVGLVQELHAQYSADGAWIYFAGVRPGRRTEIWRARADGSAAERVGPEADYYYGDTQPSPSPDILTGRISGPCRAPSTCIGRRWTGRPTGAGSSLRRSTKTSCTSLTRRRGSRSRWHSPSPSYSRLGARGRAKSSG